MFSSSAKTVKPNGEKPDEFQVWHLSGAARAGDERRCLLHAFTRLARKNAANRNLLQQNFIAYIFRSKSARERARAQERKSFIAYIFRSKKQEREWRNPVPFKENYSPPRTYYSLIGCSPSAELSSRGGQSTWGGKLPLASVPLEYWY